MIDNLETLLNVLKHWDQVRWVEGEGAHILICENDHTQSRIVTYAVWEALQQHLRGTEFNEVFDLAA